MKRTLLTLLAGTLFVGLTVCAAAAQERPQGGSTGLSSRNSIEAAQGVRVVGLLKRQGITTYMYGSHVIRESGTGRLYALRSQSPRLLDRYAGKRVAVLGTRVPGFPIEGGPPLLDVYRVFAVPVLSCSGPAYDLSVRCPVR